MLTTRRTFIKAVTVQSVAGLIVPIAPWPGLLRATPQSAGNEAAGTSSRILFFDSFESENEWQMYEEVVGGDSCYGVGIGEVLRSTDVALRGQYSQRVWANKASSPKSNHVIAYRTVATAGYSGGLRYNINGLIAPETASSGECGPEFSIQNTRLVEPGVFKTYTAGIQFQANPYLPQPASWAVWVDAQWHVFISQPLIAGVWYRMAIEADFVNNRYVRFTLQGNGLNLNIDLSQYSIAGDQKSFTQESLALTLESENLWNNCGAAGPTQYKMYYDTVLLAATL